MTKSKKKRITNTVRFIILAIYFLIVVLPIYWMVITSFKTNPEIINAQHITYFPKIFTLENYQSLFNMMDYGIFEEQFNCNAVISSCSRDPVNLWRIWPCQI